MIVLLACARLQASSLPQPLGAEDFLPLDSAKAKLGQQLFYDPILSGNRNIACSTCHHPDFGTSDGLSLGIGEGGVGLGSKRTTGTRSDRIKKRIPRNAPGLWNLGAKEVSVLFHDGRLSVSDIYQNGFNSPAEEWLPTGFSNILAAQAVFPLVAQFEMAGNPKENEVAGAIHDRIDAGWPIASKRVRAIPEYQRQFVTLFDDIDHAEDITIVHIANALGEFIGFEWQSYDSPFDDALNGNLTALTPPQQRGLSLFYGRANCASCHSGKLLTDHKFHALALPQFGPGRTRRFDPYARDVGRMSESDSLADAYRFRTPSLRNVALTAPYGHNGAYRTLAGIITHHKEPAEALKRWTRQQAELPAAPWLASVDFVALDDRLERERLAARIDIKSVELSSNDIADLVAFMHALTGRESVNGRLGVPETVPSGLPVDK